MSFSFPLKKKRLDFFVVRSFAFELTSFFNIVFTTLCLFYSVVNVLLYPKPLNLSIPGLSVTSFLAIYYFNFGFVSSALLRLLYFISQPNWPLQTGGFLTEHFNLIASINIVNFFFYISLHVIDSFVFSLHVPLWGLR